MKKITSYLIHNIHHKFGTLNFPTTSKNMGVNTNNVDWRFVMYLLKQLVTQIFDILQGFNENLYNYFAISHSGLRFAARDSLEDQLNVVTHIQ